MKVKREVYIVDLGIDIEAGGGELGHNQMGFKAPQTLLKLAKRKQNGRLNLGELRSG